MLDVHEVIMLDVHDGVHEVLLVCRLEGEPMSPYKDGSLTHTRLACQV